MIVTCERCTTQFQLDDARIPTGGVRVRCSRCKHAFEIELPSLDAPAAPALASDPEPGETLPDLPPDLPPDDEPWGSTDELGALDGSGSASDPDAPSLAAQRSSLLAPEEEPSLLDEGRDDEESDWEFNEDPPASSADSEPADGRVAADVVDDFLRSERSTLGGTDATPHAELGQSPSGLDLADASSGFELAETSDRRGGVDGPTEPTESVQQELPPGDPVEAMAARPAEPSEPDPGASDSLFEQPAVAEAVETETDELGSPEAWDLFSEDDAASKSRAPGVRLPAPVEFDADPIGERPPWLGWLSQAGGLAGWIAVAVLFAHGVVTAVVPATPATIHAQARLAGDLAIEEAAGVWIDNAVAGSIYVISGRLRNEGSSRIASPALAVELLDGGGRIVADLPVPLEAPHSRRNLRELAPDELPHGRPPGAGRPIAPGASVPFQAVVGPVPRQAHTYRVVDAPPSLRATPSPTPASEASPSGVPKPRRRSSSREMIAEREPATADSAEAAPSPEATPAGTPAAPAPPL